MLTDEELTLNLLKFALKRVNPPRIFTIMEKEVSEPSCPLEWGGLVLERINGYWTIYAHDERYNVGKYTVHHDHRAAAEDFYYRCVEPMSHTAGMFKFRQAWERETGLQF